MSLEKAIGLTLKKYRILSELTQEQLALQCDLDRTHIGMVERGNAKVSVEIIYKICKNLNVKISVFFAEVEELMDNK